MQKFLVPLMRGLSMCTQPASLVVLIMLDVFVVFIFEVCFIEVNFFLVKNQHL